MTRDPTSGTPSSELLFTIDEGIQRNRRGPNRELERDILCWQENAFRAGVVPSPAFREPNPSRAAAKCTEVGLPMLSGPLDAEEVRASIAAHGSALVRGLLGDEAVSRLLNAIRAAFSEHDAVRRRGEIATGEWYSEFPLLRFPWHRKLTDDTGGMLGVDSPRALFQCFEALSDAGITNLVTGYHGGRWAFTAEKTVFRRVTPENSPAPDIGWHQDGSFMGTDHRVLNVWVALTDCGRDAPGLELFPSRLDRILPNDGGMILPPVIREELSGRSPLLPEFRAGDVLFFDHLCAHRTACMAGMTKPRFALECWTFAPANVPRDYTGLIM